MVNSQLRQVPVAGRSDSLSEAEIIHSDPQQYPITRRWAQFFYNGIPTLQGLAWRPRLGGEGSHTFSLVIGWQVPICNLLALRCVLIQDRAMRSWSR